MKKIAWAFALIAPLALAACGDDNENENELVLSESNVSLDYKAEKTLTANEKGGVWGSSNTFVATVTDGKIEAKHVGTATITYTKGGDSATCKVTVVPTNNDYFIPMTTWGANQDGVKSFMGEHADFSLNTNLSNDSTLAYVKTVGTYPIYVYEFKANALNSSSISIPEAEDDAFMAFVKQYYVCVLDGSDGTDIVYANAPSLDEASEAFIYDYALAGDDVLVNCTWTEISRSRGASISALREASVLHRSIVSRSK